VGHAQGQIEMPGMTGGSLPASIWRTYMGRVLEGRDVEQFPSPDLTALAERMSDEQFTVPDVVRMTEGEALAALGKRRFIGEVRTEYSSAAAGTVVWQSPSAGESASPGETVYIGVSSGYIPPPKPSGGGGGGGDKKETEAPADDEDTSGDEESTGDTGDETDSGGGGNGNGNGNGKP
jgi:serine/threonine-protein kinase